MEEAKKVAVNETVRKIKQSFRLRMNGVVSHSMREKGVNGYLNWGIQLPELRLMAADYDRDYDLASALWKENVRECKILATLIMPSERMDVELVNLWMEQITTSEMVEYAVFNLFQFVDGASDLAFVWMATDNEIYQIGGYNLFSCLLRRNCQPNERDLNKFFDQAVSAIQSGVVQVEHAVMNCLNSYAALGEGNERLIMQILQNNLS